MSKSEHTQRRTLEQVQAYRSWIGPVEAVAAAERIAFDTVIKPDTASRPDTIIDLQATVKATLTLEPDFDKANIAECYAQVCEHYAAKLAELAKTLRRTFPAKV